MSQMEKLAQSIGVEIDEVFDIIYDGKRIIAKIKEDGIEPSFLEEKINEILSSDYKIKRYGRPPELMDKYYSIDENGEVTSGIWLNDYLDLTLYIVGNYYRDPEEAKKDSIKWLTFYRDMRQGRIKTYVSELIKWDLHGTIN